MSPSSATASPAASVPKRPLASLPGLAGLPVSLRRLLLVGGRGPGLVPARDAALAGGAAVSCLADRLALAVWEDAPLDAAAATVLARRQADRPFLPPDLARTVVAVAAQDRAAGDDPEHQRLAARRDVPGLTRLFLGRLAKAPDDLAAARGLASVAPMAADPGTLDAAATVLAGLPGVLAPLGLAVAGELALLAGRPELAVTQLRTCLDALSFSGPRFPLAQARLALGDREGARAELSRLAAVRPLDALAMGRLHALRQGLDTRLSPLPGPVTVLLYTFDNAVRLDRTLAALAATDQSFAPAGGGPRLLVLDNGCRDDTAAVLAAWRDRLGDTLGVVRLPVNVGAPAARNWLASLPAVRERAFAVYLDDDALVPPDWLGRLGAVVAVFPEAGVYGCRVRGSGAPRFAQSADGHLWPTPRQDAAWGRGFTLLRPWLHTPDWGQYALTRPCATVTGCCHLFLTETLTATGGFDLRFSPSQYDDLDHDLRRLGQGRVAVCAGELVVVHDKATGATTSHGGPGYGSGFANQFKLHHKYDDAALARFADTAFAALARDAAAKARDLSGGAPTPWDLADPNLAENSHGQ